jgi:hypothetical protein
VPRLLQKRRDFRDLADPSVSSSVTAFLAWKAFLIVARGSSTGIEKIQCRHVVRATAATFPELRAPAKRFASALKAIAAGTPTTVADWYSDPALEADDTRKRVQWAKRSIAKLNETLSSDRVGDSVAEELADHVYAIRSAVLAHGAIHSTGNLFQLVVPAFEDFVSMVACAGYAQRAGITLTEALEECRVVS